MSLVDQAIQEASRLPLLDAAYVLWVRRLALDHAERPVQPHCPRANLRDPESLASSIREALAKVQTDRATAQDAPTFERLKRAHPAAGEFQVKEAIKAAVKFEGDCARYYSPQGSAYLQNIQRAVGQAKAANPGFQESTYRRAELDLAQAMR